MIALIIKNNNLVIKSDIKSAFKWKISLYTYIYMYTDVLYSFFVSLPLVTFYVSKRSSFCVSRFTALLYGIIHDISITFMNKPYLKSIKIVITET